jgi:hypothetical protein
MNKVFLHRIFLFLSTIALLSFAGLASAKECWLEVYDKANFEGEHVRIPGPAELASLKSLNGQDWSNRIESVVVGPDAEVLAFRQERFQAESKGPINHPEAFTNWGKGEIPGYGDMEITFGPGKKEHHLGELNFHRNINSLKIMCRR